MAEEKKTVLTELDYDIKDKIHTIRGVPVMLDRDIAKLYEVETRILNQTVKRNPDRFPSDYCFQLSNDEFEHWKSQIVMTNSEKMGLRRNPYAFTERGVAMLSTVLHSNKAISISMKIMDAFVAMRHYLSNNTMIFQRLDRIELKQLEADDKFNQIFKQLEAPKQKKSLIFFKGQLWDATSCIEQIISKAEKSIILIDNYVDRSTLDMLSRKRPKVSISIYTMKRHCELSEKEKQDFNNQYGPLTIRYTDQFHARFLIIDMKTNYHIEASLKDAGNRAFAIMVDEDEENLNILFRRLESIRSFEH